MKKSINRRQLLQGIGLAAGSGLIGPRLTFLANAQTGQDAQGSEEKRPWYDLGLIPGPILNDVVLFYLAQAWQASADVGEVLATASRVNPEDEWSWPNEWFKTAERMRRVAEASLAAKHKVSAGEAYLRASSYYRAALHHHPEPTDPGVVQMTRRAVSCFEQAIPLLSLPARAVKIPYEGTTLPAYYFQSPKAPKKAPLLIVHQGRDAWAEDCKYLAEGATRRGFNCLLVNGPGQGPALRLQKLSFRPDWEKVVTPVVDYAISSLGVDPKRIALMGISMGGALAPRAAAFEKRIKLLIANPGVLDWSDTIYSFIGALNPDLIKLLETNPQGFNPLMEAMMKESAFIRWGVKDTVWKHGATSPLDMMRKVKAFNNEGIVGRISCRTLVMDGEAEAYSTGGAKKLYDALRAPKDYMLFTAEDTGLLHVQTGALAVSSQRLFDWLEAHL